MTRKQANLEIMNRLSEYLATNPDMRFGQALRNLGIIVDFFHGPEGVGEVRWMNHFNEEPAKMLERMDKVNKRGAK